MSDSFPDKNVYNTFVLLKSQLNSRYITSEQLILKSRHEIRRLIIAQFHYMSNNNNIYHDNVGIVEVLISALMKEILEYLSINIGYTGILLMKICHFTKDDCKFISDYIIRVSSEQRAACSDFTNNSTNQNWSHPTQNSPITGPNLFIRTSPQLQHMPPPIAIGGSQSVAAANSVPLRITSPIGIGGSQSVAAANSVPLRLNTRPIFPDSNITPMLPIPYPNNPIIIDQHSIISDVTDAASSVASTVASRKTKQSYRKWTPIKIPFPIVGDSSMELTLSNFILKDYRQSMRGLNVGESGYKCKVDNCSFWIKVVPFFDAPNQGIIFFLNTLIIQLLIVTDTMNSIFVTF